jgi:exosortase/archaeosortase family protein
LDSVGLSEDESVAMRDGLRIDARIGVAIALALTCIAFFPSIASVARTAGGSDATSLAVLAPFAVILASLASVFRVGAPEAPKLEPAMLGALPAILLGVGLTVFGPARLGFEFWYLRVDLVALEAFALGLLMLAFGTRAVIRNGVLAVVVLTFPFFVMPVAQKAEALLTTAARVVAAKIVDALPVSIHEVGNGIWEAGSGARVAIAESCTGLEGLAIVLIVATPVLVATTGPRRRKAMALFLSLAAAWLLNLARIVGLIAAVPQLNSETYDILHAVSGMVVIAVSAGLMLWFSRRVGLSWNVVGLSTKVKYTPKHVLTGALTSVAAVAIVVSAMGAQAEAGLNSISVEKQVVMTKVERDDDEDTFSLSVPGYEVRHDGNYKWFRTFFGDASQAATFTVSHGSDRPMWAQVITSPSRRKLEQYAPLNCFVAHNSKILRARRVPLPGGAGMLVDQRLRGRRFAALSWTQPVVMTNGKPGYRRMVLFADAAKSGNDQAPPAHRSTFERVTYGTLNLFSPMPNKKLDGASWGPADRQLTALARRMLSSGS